jgi:hypothetical protein
MGYEKKRGGDLGGIGGRAEIDAVGRNAGMGREGGAQSRAGTEASKRLSGEARSHDDANA